MKRSLWVCITNDKYELPVAVADTAAELARICHTTSNSIYSELSQFETGKRKSSKYRKVIIH